MLLKSSIFVALSVLSAVTPAVSVAVERSSGSDMKTTHWVIDGCKPLPPWCHRTELVHRCACNLAGKYNCKTPAFTAICRKRGCHCKYVPHHPPLEEYEGEDDFDEVEEVEDESLLGGLLEVIAKVHLL